MSNLLRLIRNSCVAAVIGLSTLILLNPAPATAEPDHIMQYDQVIVHEEGGGTKVCWHCAHTGDECTDYEHSLIACSDI